MKRLFQLVLPLLFVCCCIFAAETDSYYTEEQVYNLRPRPDQEKTFGHIGASGLVARVYKGVIVRIESILPGTPAAGKFEKGETITGVNGVSLAGRNPFVVLGDVLNAAESTDGILTFDIQDNKGAARQVKISVPVLGTYSKTWPLKCRKSERIIKEAADYYSTDKEFENKHLKNRGIGGALACLFLLSTGDDKYIPCVKEYFARFPKNVEGIGDHTWNNGYNGIACAEYYLRTGDESVLPIIQYYCDDARERQSFECSWNHWGYGVNPGYVAGGLMNPAGAQLVTTLLLGKECGVNVDQKTMLNALRFWYRFTGHGTVPYGDHRPEGGLGSNGKDGMSAIIMQIASGAKGDVAIYNLSKKRLSMSIIGSYPVMVCGHGDNGRGDAMWRGVASALLIDDNPGAYHEVMNRLEWWYTLSRRPSGAFGVAALEGFDDEGSGAGLALAYTAPLKKLRIVGAPRSPHAKDFELPKYLWGTEADLAFLSIDHNPKYLKYGKPEPIHIPFYKYGSAYSKPGLDLKSASRADMVKNVFHERDMIRCQAAKALREAGAFKELEILLRYPDPRVRRAALEGMIDYQYWFSAGSNAIKPEQFTPGMIDAISKMLSDPKEAWWVVDGALMAMKFAPASEIDKCLPLILPWTKHEEWWLRESSFTALTGLQDDEALLAKVLPVMNKMMIDEYHTQPRERMLGALRKVMQKQKKTSPAGQEILASFLRAVKESEIKPNEGKGRRSSEGAHNVVGAADACLREAPETVMEVAKTIQSRFNALETQQIIQLVGTPNSNREGKPYGFYTVLEKQSPEQRKELEEILCVTYLGELKNRRKSGDKNDMPLIDTIIDLAKIRDPDAGWNPIGKIKPADRIWRFMSFDPKPEDKMHPREKRRFRDVALPEGLDKWYMPEFDDSKWNSGKAPVGVGEHREGRVSFTNNSEWGEGEFILMRSTFELEKMDYDSYRISILAKQGFHVYLNGQKIHTYVWWKDMPHYRLIALDGNHTKHLKIGNNVLAVYANVEYQKGTEKPAGQIDVYIEGLKKSDLE